MTKTFESYLHRKFEIENPRVLDDDMPDKYEDWIANLDTDVALKYADEIISDMEIHIENAIAIADKLSELGTKQQKELESIMEMVKHLG